MTVMCCNRVLVSCLIAFGMTLWPALGVAEVRLESSVEKVVTAVDAQGRAERTLLPADAVLPGDELRYVIRFTNHSATRVDAGRVVVTNPIPTGTHYVPGTAGGAAARVEYSVDGATFTATEPAAPPAAPGAEPGGVVVSLRWHYGADLRPGRSGEVHFHVRVR
jgi:uncharacterized repeat protein (TIGR01451 family)